MQKFEKSRVIKLLKTWCDALVKHQIENPTLKSAHGGFFCPACVMVHGRICDAVYPLTYMYMKSGDAKYLEAAKKAVDWCENNVLRDDGSYGNDKNKLWICTTAFSQASFGNVLLKLSPVLDTQTHEKWYSIFIRQTDFICDYFLRPDFSASINYSAQFCLCMAMAYKLTGDEKYKKVAYDKYKSLLKCFTSEGLLYGEGNIETVTENGSRCIDIGYNVEESLPALIGFADLMNDRQAIIDLSKKMKTHLEFMLPDGAWDNSWGSRSYKWTYWGSRTSDGAQGGLMLLAKHTGDKVFEQAAIRNFLLYERCTTSEGLLAGGLMYGDAKEDVCIHHTFCHAKALCEFDEYLEQSEANGNNASLPRESEYGAKFIPVANVALVSHGKWRATISTNDYRYVGNAIGGGTLCLAWHEDMGAVLSKSMSQYNPIEPLNMQHQRHASAELCMTPRVMFLTENADLVTGKGVYSSDNAVNAGLELTSSPSKEPVIIADGIMRDSSGHELSDGSYRLTYSFEKRTDSISIKISTRIGGTFSIPVIVSANDKVNSTGKAITIERGGKIIEVSASKDIVFGYSHDNNHGNRCSHILRGSGIDTRAFCTVGGFMFAPLTVSLDKGKAVYVRIAVK